MVIPGDTVIFRRIDDDPEYFLLVAIDEEMTSLEDKRGRVFSISRQTFNKYYVGIKRNMIRW